MREARMTTAVDPTTLEVTNLTPRIGAEIKADVESLLSGCCAKQIRELLDQRGVLVFRELNFDDEQQKTFTKTLGELNLQKDKEFMNISLDKSVNQELAEYHKGT